MNTHLNAQRCRRIANYEKSISLILHTHIRTYTDTISLFVTLSFAFGISCFEIFPPLLKPCVGSSNALKKKTKNKQHPDVGTHTHTHTNVKFN